MRCVIASMLSASIAAAPGMADARLTDKCNESYSSSVQVAAPSWARDTMVGVANQPASNPALYEALLRPLKGAQTDDPAPIENRAILYFDPLQDIEEIAGGLRVNDALGGLDLIYVAVEPTTCPSPGTPPKKVVITEYYHAGLDHYFLSSTDAENAILDSGRVGPWVKTGEQFLTVAPDPCFSPAGIRPVRRFFKNVGTVSHFYTPDAAECGAVRKQAGWLYEGDAFGSYLPSKVDGLCPAETRPLFRFYNNRARFNDGNHRFVRLELYEAMARRGWIAEGVGLCLTNHCASNFCTQ